MSARCILIVLCLSATALWAQKTPLRSSSVKAKQAYQMGLSAYDQSNFTEALLALRKAVVEDAQFIEAWLVMAEIYEQTQAVDSAIQAYTAALAISQQVHPRALLNLAELQYRKGKYSDALDNTQRFLQHKTSEKSLALAQVLQRRCSYALEMMAHPVPFSPHNMGDSINSLDDEYLPALTADSKTLIITRRYNKSYPEFEVEREEEDFFISHLNDSGVWSLALPMPEPVNSGDNEGAQSISPDGRYLFFSGCNRKDGMGSCDIYVSRRVGDRWSKPFNLGEPVNSRAWESQPSIASDGSTLYFASNRSGGKGGSDIWKTTLLESGLWSDPINLGDSINTPGSETSPFIHYDNQTLYFSSDGHPGMGGKDLYMIKKKIDGSWGRAKNLGYPINTEKDEISLIVNSSGDKAYFSSDKSGGKGKQDIYVFDLYAEARPLPVSYLKGKLFDYENDRPLEARFEIINLRTGQTVAGARSDEETGDFLLSLPTEDSYALNVSKDGYLFYSENFTFDSIASLIQPKSLDVPLKTPKIGESMVLRNIFFETNLFQLKDESRIELDRLVEMMQKNPKLKIEIGGHTDNTGQESFNLRLSENRAKSVAEYLISKGISADRLTFVGFGFRQPMSENDSEEGRARNRRTEIKITQI